MKRLQKCLLVLTLICILLSSIAYAKPHLISPDNLGVSASWAKFNVKIRTNEKCYQEGERLVATISANRNCYILVYYTNEKGSCLIVYPNRYKARNHIRRGEEFVIGNNPDAFGLVVDSLKVRDYLQVIATDKPIDVSSLAGIKSPQAFVNKLRLILKERVERRASQLGSTSNVPLSKKVFAVGTTDYLCNYSSYTPSGYHPVSSPPVVYGGSMPAITIRSVDVPGKDVRIVGPSVPVSGTSSSSGGVYSVGSSEALISGTVSYRKGVKKILVDGRQPTILRIGSSKSVIIEGPSETRKSLDFRYLIDGLKSTPRSVTITAVGMDGKKSRKTIQIRRK